MHLPEIMHKILIESVIRIIKQTKKTLTIKKQFKASVLVKLIMHIL